jgi:AAA+ superfamily predicted ATPase
MNFTKFLKTTSLEKHQINDLRFFYEYLNGEHNSKVSSKIVALIGEAGIGKTYLAKRFAINLNIPVFYVGQENIPYKNVKKYSTLNDLNEAKIPDNCLVYLDDLTYLLEETEYGEVSVDCKRLLFKLFAKVQALPRAGILFTTNYLEFDTQFIDRLDIVIEMEAPNKLSKKKFLTSQYNDFLDKNKINNITSNSTGFNFRDLNEVVKRSFRYGKGKFTEVSIKSALDTYSPTNFRNYDVHKNVKINFKDVIGRKNIKDQLKQTIILSNNKRHIDKFGLKRANLLIFHGEAGLGKTYMAKALAGELGYPLVNLDASSIYSIGSPFGAFNNLSKFAKRFKDSIILIDEADKLIGRNMFDMDGPMQGMLNELFDGVKNIGDSIIILAMNNVNNFGTALHDRFTLIEFDYPNSRERKEFFQNKIKNHKDIFYTIKFEDLSKRTQKMSFRDIEKIWNQVIFGHLSTKKKIGMKEFEDTITPFKKTNEMVFG